MTVGPVELGRRNLTDDGKSMNGRIHVDCASTLRLYNNPSIVTLRHAFLRGCANEHFASPSWHPLTDTEDVEGLPADGRDLPASRRIASSLQRAIEYRSDCESWQSLQPPQRIVLFTYEAPVLVDIHSPYWKTRTRVRHAVRRRMIRQSRSLAGWKTHRILFAGLWRASSRSERSASCTKRR